MRSAWPIIALVAAIGCAKPTGLEGADAAGSSGPGTADATNDATTAVDAMPTDAGSREMAQLAYMKASNPGAGDQFGYAVALSADGSTLAVGAPGKSSAEGSLGSGGGAVYVFVRAADTWVQQAYLQGSNAHEFGLTLGLSADGSTLAVGDAEDASSGTGIDPVHTDEASPGAGAVYVFTRSGATWSQQAYLKGAHTRAGDCLGEWVAVSADGTTLAAGAPCESGGTTGINGNQLDTSAQDSGAAYVFTRAGATWTQQAYIKASNTNSEDRFGITVTLSGDGSTLAVGAPQEASAATGVDGDQADNSAANAGAAYVFTRVDTTWRQQAYIKASNTDAEDYFGYVALSSDGTTLAVAAIRESSAATGIDGNQSDNSAMFAGAVYVFARSASSWTQQAYLKASNTGAGDSFGFGLALSEDGSTLAADAFLESSATTGIDGNQADNSAPDAGAAYVFVRSGASWSQFHYVKESNTNAGDEFGESCALSGDGSTFASGGILEDSAASGIDGNQADNSLSNSGAVYVFGTRPLIE